MIPATPPADSATPPACVFLALGSNLGDRLAHLRAAIDQLRTHFTIDRCSSVYETEPAYVADQPPFLNLVLRGSTLLTPRDLLSFVKAIEQTGGREETVRFGPRAIDLDILLYNDLVTHTPDLIVPHPRMLERAFVLVPLAEIAPDLIVPGQQEPVDSVARRAGHYGDILRVVARPAAVWSDSSA